MPRRPGRPRLEIDRISPGTQKVYDQLQAREIVSPRVSGAMKLYTSGAVPTKKAAAEAMGLSPTTLYIASTRSPAVQMIQSELQAQIDDKAISMSALLATLSRRAVGTIATIMDTGEKEETRLKAAIDLADRGPESSKIQKHQVESFTLDGKDVAALATALAESRKVTDMHGMMQGDYEKLSTTTVVGE